MTTVLIILAGTGALAGVIFGLLYKRERRIRKQAEKAAELQAIRADAEAVLRRQQMAAEEKWRRKYEGLKQRRETVAKEATAKREEIDDTAGDPAGVAAALNRVLGHDKE